MILSYIKLYRRFFRYISATRNISAIFQIYRPQLEIYQRFLKYIDLPTKRDNLRKKKEAASYGSLPYF
ncbi:hypothetical protein BCN_1065 [Bacillus cereus NC7401]|nr:hypothetical protein BCN_1065 [Bacillus cereus NC7401]